MTKRAFGKFKRRRQDTYDTPPNAVQPLLEHLSPRRRFVEPCAGAGHLSDALEAAGHICLRKRDLEPRRDDIERKDALTTLSGGPVDYFITNPPWSREILHPLISFLSSQHPTWLLFDADWMHTKQAASYLFDCEKIVSVGRVSWMGNGVSGFDNCAWYLFDANHIGPTRFYGRK